MYNESTFMSTHLMVRSAYSLLQGTMGISQLVHQAKSLGYKSVALTDRLSMSAVPEFMLEAQKEGIHPIIGVELDLLYLETTINLVCLAKNNNGYRWLIKFSSRQNTTKLALSIEDLILAKEDVVFILPSVNTLFEPSFLREDTSSLKQLITDLSIKLPFVWIGITKQESAFYQKTNALIKKLIGQGPLKSVALHQVYYADSNDEEIYRVVRAIDQQLTLKDERVLKMPYRYMLDPLEMNELYEAEDLLNTDLIAESCQVSFIQNKTALPRFETPSGTSTAQYLTQLCLQGLTKRYGIKVPSVYKQRLKEELDIIVSMHYEDYFLIVWDFILYAKKSGIYVGPGRGSAAGSLVAYCLGITHVDPIKFNLLFERFLNPERISMPDIDTDFPDDRRDEVIRYVCAKYGNTHVAHISTFGTLAAKQVLRDVGRVMDISVRELDTLSKAIPFAIKITLKDAYQSNIKFKNLIDSNLRYTKLYQLALGLEGLPRHISTHAAGVVMSGVDLSEIVPLIQVESDMVSTQYTMEYLEALGLIKMDFLGLRNLTIIDQVVKLIKKHQNIDLEILKIPLDDPKTLELCRKVDTVGIFQLESDGMKNLLRQMKATRFEDIVATIALFRPGPMENIPAYIKAKENASSIHYLHPDLKAIVEDTYGILIYQEQIMQVAQKMAGFTLGKADLLRKAMSKKDPEKLLSLKQEFIEGCLKKGRTQELAIELYELIFKFANYGFNKSHSVAYAMISYQMAYLKANYPSMFYAALLRSVIGGEQKTSQYLEEAKLHGVSILPPSINESTELYELSNQGIRLPLLLIRSVGGAACREILNERELGLFTSFHDFIARINTHRFSRNSVEALIDAGSFDEFGYNRKSLLASLDEAYQYADLVKIEGKDQTRIDLGLVMTPDIIKIKENPLEKAEREKLVLGFYLSDHPLFHIKEQHHIKSNILSLQPNKQVVKLICMIKGIKQHRTKKGDLMAFLSLSDESSECSGVLMPNLYIGISEQLIKGIFVMIEGYCEEEGSLFIKKIELLSKVD